MNTGSPVQFVNRVQYETEKSVSFPKFRSGTAPSVTSLNEDPSFALE